MGANGRCTGVQIADVHPCKSRCVARNTIRIAGYTSRFAWVYIGDLHPCISAICTRVRRVCAPVYVAYVHPCTSRICTPIRRVYTPVYVAAVHPCTWPVCTRVRGCCTPLYVAFIHPCIFACAPVVSEIDTPVRSVMHPCKSTRPGRRIVCTLALAIHTGAGVDAARLRRGSENPGFWPWPPSAGARPRAGTPSAGLAAFGGGPPSAGARPWPPVDLGRAAWGWTWTPSGLGRLRRGRPSGGGAWAPGRLAR